VNNAGRSSEDTASTAMMIVYWRGYRRYFSICLEELRIVSVLAMICTEYFPNTGCHALDNILSILSSSEAQ
jgi:hypothetical protein